MKDKIKWGIFIILASPIILMMKYVTNRKKGIGIKESIKRAWMGYG